MQILVVRYVVQYAGMVPTLAHPNLSHSDNTSLSMAVLKVDHFFFLYFFGRIVLLVFCATTHLSGRVE